MNINPYLDFRIFLISATKSWKKVTWLSLSTFSVFWLDRGGTGGGTSEPGPSVTLLLLSLPVKENFSQRSSYFLFSLYSCCTMTINTILLFFSSEEICIISSQTAKKIDKKKNKKVISNLMSDQVTNYVFNPGRDQCSGVDVRPWSWLTFAVVGHVWQCGGVAAVFMETVVPLWKCGWR